MTIGEGRAAPSGRSHTGPQGTVALDPESSVPRLPSIRQMAQRANEGHLKALLRLIGGRPVVASTEPPSAIRGMRTVMATLARWECTEVVNGHTYATERGCTLAGALVDKGWRVG